MNKSQWERRVKFVTFWKNLGKRLQGLFFQPTTESLKSINYNDLPAPIAWEKLAGEREINVEIGSGHGEVLLANNRDKSIIVGYEIRTRFFKLTQRKTRKRQDIFVYQGNGYESTMLHYKDYSISNLFVLFPDPWHKRKHNKRRPLVAEYFLQVAQKLKNGGRIVIATDWTDYAEFIKKEVEKIGEVYDVEIKPYVPEEFSLPITHFHQKWVRKGRSFTAFVLKKKNLEI